MKFIYKKLYSLFRCWIYTIVSVSTPAIAQENNWDLSSDTGVELRIFPKSPKYEPQLNTWQPSLMLTGAAKWQSIDGVHQTLIETFVRIDWQDNERTHIDLREAYYRYSSDSEWSVLIGATKVFWGVAESLHLVNIINQTDMLEDIDGEDKLGQPMIQFSLEKDWGTLDFFVLPFFRERYYPGENGRLRLPFTIDKHASLFDGSKDKSTLDFSLRYSHYMGAWDISFSIFNGLSREPRLATMPSEGHLFSLYDKITQYGFDVQYTTDAWLWKFETIYRNTDLDNFSAFVGGFEYTFYQILGESWDLGIIIEYQYDNRKEGSFQSQSADTIENITPNTIANNDLFYGVRLALNDIQDTALLFGITTDVNDGSSLITLEANRRINNHWTIDIEGRFFEFLAPENSLYLFKNDDFLNINITRRF
ncbi:hypothetical protein A9Q74_02300 [Colwellia sp. 39_35_sub15_T18]|nr:hypothetical protein A9Q74_02300 [Colwellia sp. 39_35_sub15_T18]